MQSHLPIHEIVPNLKTILSSQNTAILQASPGAGKSTVLPLLLLKESWLAQKKIIMLEPRRLAAKAVAWRLAELLGEEPGETVGYRVRFETRIGKKTRIEVVTEGILTRMLQQDNSLEDSGLVIFDEFHERSLHADLALAICRESQQVLRNDMRILIMSATLDGDNLSELLGNAPVLRSEGRQFPVTCIYTEPDKNISIAQNTTRVILKALREQKGDLLVFLPGSGDINRVAATLSESLTDIRIHPLYGDLPHEKQQEALMPDTAGHRKIILSTSIAETSLTIEGIRVVIDSGYSRVAKFDPRTGMTRLETIRSTRDTADQRAGRAGRLEPGVCYRLWPETTNHHLIDHREPEILQADLSPLLLELANWGQNDPNQLTWLTPPPESAIIKARELLEGLDAIKDGKITALGRKFLAIPAHPRIAHLLLSGEEQGLGSLAADVAAILEERDPLSRDTGTDIFFRLQALQNKRNKLRVSADNIILERIERIATLWRKQLNIQLSKESVEHFAPGNLIAAAYPGRIAKKENSTNRYRLANGRVAVLPDHDPLSHEEWIAIAQLDAGTKEGKIFLAAAFDPAEMISKAQCEELIEWDSREGCIKAKREWKIGNLIAQSKPLINPDSEKIIPLLFDVIRKEGLRLFELTPQAEQFRARVLSLNKWRPELVLPDFSDDGLLLQMKIWAGPSIEKIRKRDDFRKLDFLQMIKTLLSWEQSQLLSKYAPEKISVPSGSEVLLNYSNDGNAPVLAVRLQEVFGLQDTPKINEGRNPVLLHLLSPGYKPVQVTQDLRSFWTNIYPEVRKELRVRYQKHSWPEDPWTAVAIKGVKRR
ncbi:MAG: ATP-dependent helicase HrpB [Bacteroidia bacterium]|nr:ATP-dependent helicase HrpB [Bacteroidia bacterium]